MTPEAQRIAIAEFCGYSFDTTADANGNYWLRKGMVILGGDCESNIKSTLLHLLPDYLNDLNAMHEAEGRLTGGQWTDYVIRLEKRGGSFPDQLNVSCVISFYIAHATAAQRAEALLRTIGKWANMEEKK